MHVQSATSNSHNLWKALQAFVLTLMFVAPLFAPAQAACTGTCDANGQCSDGTGICPLSAAQAAANTDDQVASDPQLSSQGIFGCLGQGARVANVGTTRAVGGVYVPVNDAAVTLNTGFLVYKECILDGMARRIAQSGTAELGRQALESFETGRNGNAQYVRNQTLEILARRPGIVADTLSTESLGAMCGAFRPSVQRAITRGFLQTAGSPGQMYACPFTSGLGGFYDNWFASINPNGNVYGATALAQGELSRRFAEDERNTRQMWDWGRGAYSTLDGNANPLRQNILTPGFLIAGAISQAMGSGYRQLEGANEIDQVVTNLFAGLTTRLVSSGSGVPGLFVSTGNQPAYIDRMVAQTQASVRTGAVNAAINILAAARQTEAIYLEAKQGIANALLNTINQLHSYESQCWDLIIPAVRTHAQTNGNPTLTIATSTQFSQAVIDDPANAIRDLASTTAAQVTTSQQAVALIEQLIAAVTNNASTQAQQQALIQLDQMVANNQLHSSDDAQAAADQRGTITAALTTLLNDTKTAWADSQDVNVGWCNINNPAVVERWFNAWRQ